MIDVKDLRIGNWVSKNTNKPIQVRYEMFGSITHYGDLYNPIPLTPEILEKCGFQNTVGESYEMDDFRVWLEPTGTYVFFEQKIRLRIDFIHQLQNLYYCLTNKELTITL